MTTASAMEKNNQPLILERIGASIATKQALMADGELLNRLHQAIEHCLIAYRNRQKVLFCGNGGSAADAQHLAAELSGRFYFDRPPLFAEALHVNTSYLTAVANDYGYAEVFARLVRAMGEPGDVLIALSTSGNSPNILEAIAAAKAQKMVVLGFTGQTGGAMVERCDVLLNVPSTDTPRIQECHLLLGHILCEVVEQELFKSKLS